MKSINILHLIFFLTANLIFVPKSFCQVSDTLAVKRVEIDINNEIESVERQFLNNGNVVFFYPTKEKQKNSRSWEIIEMDSNLNVINRVIIPCIKKSRAFVLNVYSMQTNVITFFVSNTNFWTSKSESWIVTYDYKSKQTISKMVDYGAFLKRDKILKVGNKIYTSGHDKDYKPLVAVFDTESQHLDTIDLGQNNKAASVTEIGYIPEKKQILLALCAFKDKRSTESRLIVLDEEHKIIANSSLNVLADSSNYTSNIRLDVLNGKLIVSGTYTTHKPEPYRSETADKLLKIYTPRIGYYAIGESDVVAPPQEGYPVNGVFVVDLDENYGVKSKWFYDFAYMKSIEKVLSPRQLKKLESYKHDKHKKEYDFGLYYMYQGILDHQGDLIVHGDLFYPIYGPNVDFDSYHNSPSTGFYGYTYPGFLTIALDKNGKKIWDVSDTLDYYRIFDLGPKSLLESTDTSLSVTYFKNEANYRIDLRSPLKTSFLMMQERKKVYPANPAVVKTLGYSQSKWYGKNEILYGFQRVINHSTRKERDVFFVEKVR